MSISKLTAALASGVLALAVQTGPAVAMDWPGPLGPLPKNTYSAVGDQLIHIECAPGEPGCTAALSSGTTADGTMFFSDANPSNPSTGTGVFQPFKRVQRSTGKSGSFLTFENEVDPPPTFVTVKSQLGFNTDASEPIINFNTKNGSAWTRSVTMDEFEFITIGGQTFIELSLDANQTSCSTCDNNKLALTDMQIYIGQGLDNPESIGGGVDDTGYTGTVWNPTDNSLLGQAPVWQLDSLTNGNVDILIQASICDSNGQCGSGHGDMSVLVPIAQGGISSTDNFVLYTEYLYVNDGFEEWKFRDTPGGDTPGVPEPATLAVFAFGLAGLGYSRRRRAA